MSYILDALNKSEKERAKKRIPGLSALQDGGPTPSLGTKRPLMVLAGLVILNSVGVYFYFGDRTAQLASPPAIAADSVANIIQPEPEQAMPIEQEPEIRTVPEVRTAPEINVTAHIYANDAELRMAKINGVSHHEGDQIADGHRLIEITEMGLVLEYQNERYELNVVEDWQSQ